MGYFKNGDLEVSDISPWSGVFRIVVPLLDSDSGDTTIYNHFIDFSFRGESLAFNEPLLRIILPEDDISLIREQLLSSCEGFVLQAQKQADYLRRCVEDEELFDLKAWCSLDGYSSIVNYLDICGCIPKDMVVLDLGCGGCGEANAMQRWFFRDHVRYIGVDCWGAPFDFLDAGNSEFYRMHIQEFLRVVFPHLGLDVKDVFAICTYVPDYEAMKMVEETFPYCKIHYPSVFEIERLPNLRCYDPKRDVDFFLK